MKKSDYKKLIISQMTGLAIYNEQYSILIDTLAQTCELRDKNLKEWKDSGGHMVCEYTNKANATNIQKSPFYLNNIQFNDLILKYCKELCLSPSGINKLGNPIAEEKDPLDELMEQFSDK